MSAQGRGTVRAAQDLYPTPAYCVDLILSRIFADFVATSCEPCRAAGSIYDKLPGARSYAEISEGIDYLNTAFPTRFDLIVTNPPFSLALEFLIKSLSEADTVCYLLRLNFLGTKKRRQFWQENPPSHLYVLSTRPSFTGHGTDATEYAWFCWDRGGLLIDPPGIHVL